MHLYISGFQKRQFADANMLELCGSPHLRVSIQAAMFDFKWNIERMLGGIQEELWNCVGRQLIQRLDDYITYLQGITLFKYYCK